MVLVTCSVTPLKKETLVPQPLSVSPVQGLRSRSVTQKCKGEARVEQAAAGSIRAVTLRVGERARRQVPASGLGLRRGGAPAAWREVLAGGSGAMAARWGR